MHTCWQNTSLLCWKRKLYRMRPLSRGWGEEVLLGILGGVVPPGSPNPDPILDQKMSFSLTRHQTPRWSQNATLHVYKKQKLCHHCWDENRNKRFLKIHFELHFLSYSFGIETMNTLIYKRSSYVNYTRFLTKTAQKPQPFRPLGWHIPMWLI